MSDPKLLCTKRLSQHRPHSVAEMLAALAAHPAASQPADFYGGSGAVRTLEERTAELLGKAEAMFFIKGMIAQMTVLRAVADQSAKSNIVIHPMSHIDYDEEDALWRLHDLRPIRLGKYAPFTAAELDGVTEPIAAVVVELPLRRSGYRLPPLEDLRRISSWCRERGVHLHFDGARLWEAAAGYGVTLEELGALADSVYVSFYKGLGGLGGAAVAGEAAFIRSLSVWKTRHGGNLYTVSPYAISALRGLDEQLLRMGTYVERARGFAERLDGMIVTPRTPDVNAFHLLLKGTVEELSSRHQQFARERRIWLFNGFLESPVDGSSVAEVVIGDNSDDWDVDEAAGWMRDFVEMA